ncbi:Methylated-DNA--protein-cysteine methyltransferase [Novipirellula aureliae]|uniref:methylated-DNA--[protein]-cysteine S-methyltransferase n=1 Tax=Novipirellula aureliae TaxID=2527966 RepID=A0A5C6E936_9BACT|nr:methylated-DNA--[protein]-cysteine S-methyltransferase [Novipirellula aureliae]TWU43719.1 Methylated-DNA--protein-cysteine methyltransferase [Novipirellula aureliae]
MKQTTHRRTTSELDICLRREHDCPLGTIWTHWTKNGLYRLHWREDGGFVSESTTANWIARRQSDLLDKQLALYFKTGEANFDPIVIDSTGWTPFSTVVYEKCREIPVGTTLSYKELARRSGSEGASRAVGSAMARNRVPIVIPCHRVVAGNGRLCGFSAPGGLQTKRFLLDLESTESKSVR